MKPFFSLLLVFSFAISAKPKPNIIHIMVDDLGWQDIASHKIDGKPVYETPHMDRLTEIGRRFTQAYSPAPTCAPSRVSFLRGQYPIKTGTYHVQGGRLPRPWRTSSPLIPPTTTTDSRILKSLLLMYSKMQVTQRVMLANGMLAVNLQDIHSPLIRALILASLKKMVATNITMMMNFGSQLQVIKINSLEPGEE